MSKVIEIVVSPLGEVRVETKGFSGAECQEASRLIEQAIGTRLSEQLTADFFRATAANTISEHS